MACTAATDFIPTNEEPTTTLPERRGSWRSLMMMKSPTPTLRCFLGRSSSFQSSDQHEFSLRRVLGRASSFHTDDEDTPEPLLGPSDEEDDTSLESSVGDLIEVPLEHHPAPTKILRTFTPYGPAFSINHQDSHTLWVHAASAAEHCHLQLNIEHETFAPPQEPSPDRSPAVLLCHRRRRRSLASSTPRRTRCRSASWEHSPSVTPRRGRRYVRRNKEDVIL